MVPPFNSFEVNYPFTNQTNTFVMNKTYFIGSSGRLKWAGSGLQKPRLTLLQWRPMPIKKLSGLISLWMKFFVCTYSILLIICWRKKTLLVRLSLWRGHMPCVVFCGNTFLRTLLKLLITLSKNMFIPTHFKFSEHRKSFGTHMQ